MSLLIYGVEPESYVYPNTTSCKPLEEKIGYLTDILHLYTIHYLIYRVKYIL